MEEKEKTDKNKKNIHDGHRERLFELAYTVGFENISKYQQVEVMLCNVIPRGDVNPLAHRLLDYFGSFSAILDADIDDLASVKGLGIPTARKIKNLVPMFRVYSMSKLNNRIKITTLKDLALVFDDLLINSDEEEVVLISIDRSGVCNGVRRIAKGNQRNVGIEVKHVYRFIDTFKSYAVFIGHNHPGGKPASSEEDRRTYEFLKTAVRNYGAELKDSVVVANEGVYSMERGKFLLERKSVAYETVMDLIKQRQLETNV